MHFQDTFSGTRFQNTRSRMHFRIRTHFFGNIFMVKSTHHTCHDEPSFRLHAPRILLLFPLPSGNVQHDLQDWSLITFLKEEKLENKRKPMRIVEFFFPNVPTETSRRLFLGSAGALSGDGSLITRVAPFAKAAKKKRYLVRLYPYLCIPGVNNY